MRSAIRNFSFVLGALLATRSANAQTFPADNVWKPLTQGGVPIGDPTGDAPNERDIVGDAANPAAFVHQDASYFYFRLRVNAKPIKNDDTFEPFGWGCAVEADTDLQTYEFFAVVNGIINTGPLGQPDSVDWLWNQTTTARDSVADDAEVIVASFPRATHARSLLASSMFSNNDDWFVDWAIPLDTIRTGGNGAPGIPDGTTLRVACGTSNNARNYGADPAAGSTPNSDATLENTWSDPVTCGSGGCSPVADSDGDGITDDLEGTLGTDPQNPDSDGDGLTDLDETTPPGGGPLAKVDTDGDGTIDALDLDSDGDSLLDSQEGKQDVDADGIPNFRDVDDDADTILTKDEVTDAQKPGATDDVDNDGSKNWYDPDSDGDGRLDAQEGRADGNGNQLPAYLDPGELGTSGGAADGGPLPPLPTDDQGVLEGGGLSCRAAPSAVSAAPIALAALAVFAARYRRRRTT